MHSNPSSMSKTSTFCASVKALLGAGASQHISICWSQMDRLGFWDDEDESCFRICLNLTASILHTDSKWQEQLLPKCHIWAFQEHCGWKGTSAAYEGSMFQQWTCILGSPGEIHRWGCPSLEMIVRFFSEIQVYPLQYKKIHSVCIQM